MKLLPNLFENNRQWAESIKKIHPDFFRELSEQQSPEYLWIGCSDSRVPANEIVGLMPGEVFVHRNVANVVVHTDLNCLSVLQYAVEVLKVKHVMVVGHYGCGGVRAAMSNQKYGLIDNWLRNIKDIYRQHHEKLEAIADEEQRVNLLCELNVVEQVNNVCSTTIVQDAWDRGQELAVHGWIYSLRNGWLKDLNVCITGKEQLDDIYRVGSELGGEQPS
ncbi:MAG: carbonate dehydratase [Cellvibrionales bacterium]|nr:carbonate dehydratase [Cellvibrionales bacterium]MBK8676467.1 carbonate dehydratase [Cellvibrionales bacterium]TXH49707.1 MAG: carbonate dehydratase [Cellvibrionales bacterium]HRG49943.1 carbonate dehydratase [Pseudomonadales bacterium]